MEEKKKSIKGMILRLLLLLLLLGAVLVGGYFLLKHFGLADLTKDELRDKVAAFGIWGPLIFILISFLQVTFIPIPSTITILAGSLLFGPVLSCIYSFIGIFLGSVLAFFLGRSIGRKFVNWVVGDKVTVDKYLAKTHEKEFVVFFFMFLLPMFPDDALCAIAGITPMTKSQFIFIQCITRPIGIIATLVLMSGEFIPYHGWGLVLLIAIAILSIVAFVISYKKADAINRGLNKFFDKVNGLFKRKKLDTNNENTKVKDLENKVIEEVKEKELADKS